MNYKQIIADLQAEKSMLLATYNTDIEFLRKDIQSQYQQLEEAKAMNDRQMQENMRLSAENEALRESNKKLQASFDKLKAAPMIEAAPKPSAKRIEICPGQKEDIKFDGPYIQYHAVAEKKKPAPRSTRKK